MQGLIVCGVCGERMTVRYHVRRGRAIPEYVCQREGIAHSRPICQRIPGLNLDKAVGDLLVEAVTPLALEVTLAVQEELNRRAEEADRLRRQQVERARYEAELARRRYMRVDPDNRLVADALEAEWNGKLRAVQDAQEEYERQCKAARAVLDEERRKDILTLATDFPRLWHDARTSDLDRKRMVRLIVEDITLLRSKQITAHIRFKGGAMRTLAVPIPLPSCRLWQTSTHVVEEIDRLLDNHTDAEVAGTLNERGLRSGWGKAFDRLMVRNVRQSYGLADRFSRLRAKGLLTLGEAAQVLGVCTTTAKRRRNGGLLRAHTYNDKGESLFEPPGSNAPVKGKHKLRHGTRVGSTRGGAV